MLNLNLNLNLGFSYDRGRLLRVPCQKGERYPRTYLMFNNVSMYEDALHFKKLLEEENGQRG